MYILSFFLFFIIILEYREALFSKCDFILFYFTTFDMFLEGRVFSSVRLALVALLTSGLALLDV